MMGVSLKPIATKKRTPKPKRSRFTTATTTTAVLTAMTAALKSSTTFLTTHDIHLLPSQTLALHSQISSCLAKFSKIQSFETPNVNSSSSLNCWFARFLNDGNEDGDGRWVDYFRMSKGCFYYLLNCCLYKSLLCVVPPCVTPEFALASALYKLAHDLSFSFVAKSFGFGSCSDACRVFYGVCKVICDELGGSLCRFPGRGSSSLELVNCCGVLGVERFPIQGELLGENGFLMVQALVDCDGRFLDVSAGWPCTFDPYSVLRQTRLFSSMQEVVLNGGGPKVELFDGNVLDHYVFGDVCYPCLPWLFTPFSNREAAAEDGGLSSVEKEFNEVHERTMGCLRTAFRRVRANWKLLNRCWKEESVEFFPFIIVTACVLNNFLMERGDVSCDNDPGCVPEKEQELSIYDGEADEIGARNRDLLALHLSRDQVVDQPWVKGMVWINLT